MLSIDRTVSIQFFQTYEKTHPLCSVTDLWVKISSVRGMGGLRSSTGLGDGANPVLAKALGFVHGLITALEKDFQVFALF